MTKADFEKALLAYEYYLLASANPNIQRFTYRGILPADHTYYILALPQLLQFVQAHVDINLRMDPNISTDASVVHNSYCYGLFVYNNSFDMVSIFGSKDFPTRTYDTPIAIDLIDDFLLRMQARGSVVLPQGNVSATHTTYTPKGYQNASLCDCGGKKLGYKDSEHYGHAQWCSTLPQNRTIAK